MKGFLVRVGIDQSDGEWNAPVDPVSCEFVFVPVPEVEGTTFHPGLKRDYSEVVPVVQSFAKRFHRNYIEHLKFPVHMEKLLTPMHLDPDFAELTYGDHGHRGRPLRGLQHGDLIAFYSGLRSISPSDAPLVYALVGLYIVRDVVEARAVPADHWAANAHTRRSRQDETDIVVRAEPGPSGRLERCIPIGEYRDRAYRVKSDILSTWGGLSVKDGYVQRSGTLPTFNAPELFYAWFCKQKVNVIRRNY